MSEDYDTFPKFYEWIYDNFDFNLLVYSSVLKLIQYLLFNSYVFINLMLNKIILLFNC